VGVTVAAGKEKWGIGASLVLIAIGAILRLAVAVSDPRGFNINTAGIILMIVGATGLVASIVWMVTRRRTDVIRQIPDGTGTSRTRYSTPPPALH
jgi:hypothetical protein